MALERKTYTETGPDGEQYQFKKASTIDMAEALGGLPSMEKAGSGYDPQREIEYQVRLFGRCCVVPAISGRADLENLDHEVAQWLLNRITRGFEMDKLEQARRAL